VAVQTLTRPAVDTIPVVRARRESQFDLMWRRFRQHRLALVSLWIVVAFYLVAILAEFLAPTDPGAYSARYTYAPPQGIQLFSTGEDGSWRLAPHVNGYASEIDTKAMRRTFVIDPEVEIPVQFLAPSEPYLLAGVIPMSVKFIGVTEARAPFYILGADRLGRDLLSRLIHGTRISLSIGLAGVTLSLFFGIIIGGFAGYYGGWFDSAVMRVVEFIRSMPTIPLWLGLAAAMPKDWSALQTYFAITIILSLIGWTELARVVRGRFLSHAGHSGHDPGRDGTELPGAGAAGADRQLGHAAAGRAEHPHAGHGALAADTGSLRGGGDPGDELFRRRPARCGRSPWTVR
jgi:peptide/nickel transport system permease protein